MSVCRPLSEIQPDYNFLMGYHTGIPKEWYCGIEGITFIFMGCWNDPLIGYKGYAFNEPWFTDGLYDEYAEEVGDGNDTSDGFAEWLKENSYLLFESLDTFIEENNLEVVEDVK